MRQEGLDRTFPQRGRESFDPAALVHVLAIVRELVPEMEKRLIDEIGDTRWHQLREDLARIPQTFDEPTAQATDN